MKWVNNMQSLAWLSVKTPKFRKDNISYPLISYQGVESVSSKVQTNYLSVIDHFVRLALKGLTEINDVVSDTVIK